MNLPAVVDLFSGGGGFTLGAHAAGFATVLAIDNDLDLSATFSTNFPSAKFLPLDLSSLDTCNSIREFGTQNGKIAGVIGGPPCQGFSFIGKRDPNDPRNELVLQFFRIVAAVQPLFFVMENVPGILSGSLRKLLDDGLDMVSGDFEILPPLKLDALDFGAATSRQRIFVIGYDRKFVAPLAISDLHTAESGTQITVGDAIRDLPSPRPTAIEKLPSGWLPYPFCADSNSLSQFARTARQRPPPGLSIKKIRALQRINLVSGVVRTIHTPKVQHRFREIPQGSIDIISRCPRLSWDSPSPTLRAGTGKDRGSFQSIRPIHPEEHRVITTREAARLQGFPDWFQFHPTKWHSFRQIGNSVSPNVAEIVLRLLADRITQI